ncbi:MAG TPA: hypothetical protein VGK20_04675 [Candidatus Binatia bacterium]
MERAAAFLRRHRVLVALLAADIATKLAAFRLLPEGEPVRVLPGLKLYLAVNEWGVMGGVHGIDKVTSNPAYTMMLALGLLLFAFSVVRLASSRLGFGARVGAGTAVFFAVAFFAQAVSAPLSHLAVPTELIVATIRCAVLAVTIAFYAASRVPLARGAFTLLAAGALANAASYAYPPFAVVDFLTIPVEPLAALLGRSQLVAGQTSVGVINLADLYLFGFPLALAAWPAAHLMSAGRRRRVTRRNAAPA